MTAKCNKCGKPAQMAITTRGTASHDAAMRAAMRGEAIPICIPCARLLAVELKLPTLAAAADAEAARLARAIKLS